jgi:hypothetical protein
LAQQFLVDKIKAIPNTDSSDEDAVGVLALHLILCGPPNTDSEVNKLAESPEVAAAVAARHQFYVQ